MLTSLKHYHAWNERPVVLGISSAPNVSSLLNIDKANVNCEPCTYLQLKFHVQLQMPNYCLTTQALRDLILWNITGKGNRCRRNLHQLTFQDVLHSVGKKSIENKKWERHPYGLKSGSAPKRKRRVIAKM